ncbi:hypothetical protein DGM98_01015 [Xanthomonas citri]|uniref:Uncharacterized protein n=2 Tax=Xanthomonas citri TaxID=346 RepID=A0AB33CKN0_XANCI|nr:hypothetical protein XcvCFBP7111P_23955 [Xanthomonas citri pv. vignicola]QWN18915.1 hypothetical protein DGM98_01015 [Xanthomonas citri]
MGGTTAGTVPSLGASQALDFAYIARDRKSRIALFRCKDGNAEHRCGACRNALSWRLPHPCPVRCPI